MFSYFWNTLYYARQIWIDFQSVIDYSRLSVSDDFSDGGFLVIDSSVDDDITEKPRPPTGGKSITPTI